MHRVRVSSTVLAAVGYDESTRTLEIRFHNGSLYRYLDVPPEVVLELLQSESLGHAFTTSIRDSYAFERLR
jgi:hypothetical protein